MHANVIGDLVYVRAVSEAKQNASSAQSMYRRVSDFIRYNIPLILFDLIF